MAIVRYARQTLFPIDSMVILQLHWLKLHKTASMFMHEIHFYRVCRIVLTTDSASLWISFRISFIY